MSFKIKSTTSLMEFNDDDVNKILSKHEKDLNTVQEDIDCIKKWIRNQNHLPMMPSDQQIFNFLLMNKFLIKNTEEKIDMYYTIRTLIPDFYTNLLPSSFLSREIQKMLNLVILPKLSKNYNRIIAAKIVDNANSNFSSLAVYRYLLLLIEMKLLLDVSNSDEYILDYSNASPALIAGYSPMDIKKIATIIEKVFSNRIAAIHILNLPSYGKSIVALLKSCFNEKIRNRIYLHDNVDSLHNYFSKKILPMDYKGDEKSMAELNCKNGFALYF